MGGSGPTVRVVDDGEFAEVVAFLDTTEDEAGVPLVDEAERHRLVAASRDPSAAPDRWWQRVAERDGRIVGYVGELDGVGDLAVTGGQDRSAVIAALAEAVTDRVRQLWMRRVLPADRAVVEGCGFVVRRRLGVLGRRLGTPGGGAGVATEEGRSNDPGGAPDRDLAGVAIRGYRPGDDDEAVVEVLASAYAGTDDGGWDLATFRERRGLSWFRDEDLLVGLVDGEIRGLHWLKRRGDATGEVYNLAIHPDGQGRGLGAALLRAGLTHLATVGCTEVVLWVDLDNERAVSLYTAHGFTTRWEDVAFAPAA